MVAGAKLNQDKATLFLPYVLVLIAAGLRFYRIGDMSLWYDEAFGALLVREGPWSIITKTAMDTLPPLYYLALHTWSVVGTGEFTLRMLSALFGICSVALLFRVSATLFGNKVGLVAGLLAAVSPFQVYYSQEVRMYAPLGLLSILSVLLFCAAWQTNRSSLWFCYSLASAAALYTHTMAAVTVLAMLVFAVADYGRAQRNLRGLAVAHLAIGILYLPWLYFLPAQMALVASSFWVDPPGPLTLLTALYSFTFGSALPPNIMPLALVCLLTLFGLTIYLATRNCLLSRARASLQDRIGNDLSRPLLLVFCWLGVPILSTLIASQYKPLFLDRALISSSFALYVLLAWGTCSIKPKPVALLLTFSVIMLAGYSLTNWYTDPQYAKPPMREAALFMASRWEQGDAIVHTSDGSHRPFSVYLSGMDQSLLAGDPEFLAGSVRARSTVGSLSVIPVSIDEAVDGAMRVWLVVALDHSADWQRSQKAFFDERFGLLGEWDFGGIGLFLYEVKSE